MSVGVFDLFKIGIGPSSSHTVGPMRAASEFVAELARAGVVHKIEHLEVALYGSLAATGRGHGTLTTIMLGLEGHRPETILPAEVEARLRAVQESGLLRLAGVREFRFGEDDISLRPLTVLAGHSNGMRFHAVGGSGTIDVDAVYYSVGGGFIEREGARHDDSTGDTALPHPFSTA